VKDAVTAPKLIKELQHTNIVKVSCGSNHTLFLSKFKEVFACGDGDQGQLGQGHFRKEFSPKLISFSTSLSEKTPIIQIAAGNQHSLFLNNQGSVFATGSNLEG